MTGGYPMGDMGTHSGVPASPARTHPLPRTRQEGRRVRTTYVLTVAGTAPGLRLYYGERDGAVITVSEEAMEGRAVYGDHGRYVRHYDTAREACVARNALAAAGHPVEFHPIPVGHYEG